MNASLSTTLKNVSTSFRFVGLLHRNPAGAVDLPRMVRKEMKAMSPVEASRFLEAAKGTRQSALFNFALTTGMRPQEYLGLKWSDVDLERGSAMVQRAIVWKRPYTLSSLTNKWFKPALASERLGHSTIVLTLDTYSHVLPDMQQQAAEKIETLLFKTGS